MNKTLRKLFTYLPRRVARGLQVAAAMVAVSLLALVPGCATKGKLEAGGAYAPLSTNIVTGIVVTNSDPVLYAADAAFDLAETAVQTAFKLERDNRALLWKLDPDIKHTLDKARPQAEQAIKEYAAGRAAYIAAPTPQTSDLLTSITSKLAQIATAVTAAVTSASVTAAATAAAAGK